MHVKPVTAGPGLDLIGEIRTPGCDLLCRMPLAEEVNDILDAECVGVDTAKESVKESTLVPHALRAGFVPFSDLDGFFFGVTGPAEPSVAPILAFLVANSVSS